MVFLNGNAPSLSISFFENATSFVIALTWDLRAERDFQTIKTND